MSYFFLIFCCVIFEAFGFGLSGWNSTAYNYESQLNKVIRKLRKLLMRENQVKIILDKGNGYWLKTEEDIHI